MLAVFGGGRRREKKIKVHRRFRRQPDFSIGKRYKRHLLLEDVPDTPHANVAIGGDAIENVLTLMPFTHNKSGVDSATLTETYQTPNQFSTAMLDYNKEIRANFKKYGYDGMHFDRHAANELIAPEARQILK